MSSCSLPCASTSIGTANQLFLTLIQSLAVGQCGISPYIEWPTDYGEVAQKKGLGVYDFIIVGAGSAGAIVASRLSEIKRWKVLLLEAGGDPPIESVVPGLRSDLRQSPADWGFYAISPNACKINGDKGCYSGRGKMLGGTSSFNYMVYLRGLRSDFDEIAAQGNEGWSYDDVLPYFKKSEGNQNATIVEIEDGKYHNANGPVKIQSNPESPIDTILIEAFKEAGVGFILDSNADEELGFFNFQTTSNAGIRSSTAQAFLVPNKNRTNLHVIKHAYVNRVLLDKNNVARGVEFTYKGKYKFTAKCAKEVIVSAGSILSPPLLMRSGIGPKRELRKHKIHCKADLPVGENFKDHVSAAFYIKSNIPTEAASPKQMLDDWYQYLIHRSGSLSDPSVLGGRVDTTNSTGLPDIQYDIVNLPKNTPASYIQGLNGLGNYQKFNNFVIDVSQNHVLSFVLVNVNKPKSVGKIYLDETLEAKIFSGYLTEEDDVDTLVRGFRYLLNLVNSPSMQKYGAEFLRIPLPDCDKFPFDSDEYWKCYMRQMTVSGHHQVGTSKMGVDAASVVDPQLRVHKTIGLRVCDAGILPHITRANTNSAAMMIGEKGADLIKTTWS